MGIGAIQTSHNPPPTALIRCVRRRTRATNLRELLHDIPSGFIDFRDFRTVQARSLRDVLDSTLSAVHP